MRIRIKYSTLFLVLFFVHCAWSQVKLVVTSLPKSTPVADTLFICGSFNNWNVRDENYMLRKQPNGKLFVMLPTDTSGLEFKFTRGSWMKVETGSQNNYMPNRVYNSSMGKIIPVKIENWQDLGRTKKIDYVVFILFAVAFYGLIVLFLAVRVKKRERLKSKLFILFNSLLVLALVGSVFYNQTNLIWRTRIALVGNIGMAVWGPMLYLYITTFRKNRLPIRVWRHFLPAIGIAVYSVSRIINFEVLEFLAKPLATYSSVGNIIAVCLGWVVAMIYHMVSLKQLKHGVADNPSKKPEHELLRVVYYTSLTGLVLVVVNMVILLFGQNKIVFLNYDMVFLAISLFIFFKFYYLWKYPEIIKQKHPNAFVLQHVDQLKERLIYLMVNDKLYKNPDLNTAELSEKLNTKAHILSKLLNEIFETSFRDFINSYRIKEFIELSKTDEYNNFTYLALAFEVGFNSKSTFNLAFRKQTNMSPREYFKKHFPEKTKV